MLDEDRLVTNAGLGRSGNIGAAAERGGAGRRACDVARRRRQIVAKGWTVLEAMLAAGD